MIDPGGGWYCCTAGEAEEDGYEDEYQLEDLEITPADYVKPIVVPNFRKAWCVAPNLEST